MKRPALFLAVLATLVVPAAAWSLTIAPDSEHIWCFDFTGLVDSGLTLTSIEVKFVDFGPSAPSTVFTGYYDELEGPAFSSATVFPSATTITVEEDWLGGIGPPFDDPLFYAFVRAGSASVQISHVEALVAPAIGANFVRLTGQPLAPIPEPGTMLLLGSGLVGLAGRTRKRRQH